jgi:uncharacterized protein DUF6951
MKNESTQKEQDVQVIIEPGICGFPGSIRVKRAGRYSVTIEVKSGCQQIKGLASVLEEMTISELFLPASRNPVYRAAEMANCHASCSYPSAILKAAEVALEMALPKEVTIRFREKEDE